MNTPEKHQTEPQSEKTMRELAERFATGELTGLSEKKERAHNTDRQWQEEGYDHARTYVDNQGELVMIADIQGYIAHHEDQKTDRKLRIILGSEQSEITIPSAIRGNDAMFRSGHGSISLYDVRYVQEQEIPKALRPLIDKFGTDLFELYGNEDDENENMNTSPIRQSLETDDGIVAGEIDDITQLSDEIKKESYHRDESEAYQTEATAQRAARELKIGIFVLPKARRALRDQAYRDEIDRRSTTDRQQ